MVSVTLASRYIMSASRYHRRYQSRSSMYIHGLIPRNWPRQFRLLIPCGDWNGHVGSTGSGYKEIRGGYGYGKPDPDSEVERILEYALVCDLFLSNKCFKKRDSHHITYRSCNTATQIDCVLYPKSPGKLVMDVKEIPGEQVALQHQLLVCDVMIDMPPPIVRKFTPHLKCGSSEILKCVADSRKVK